MYRCFKVIFVFPTEKQCRKVCDNASIRNANVGVRYDGKRLVPSDRTAVSYFRGYEPRTVARYNIADIYLDLGQGATDTGISYFRSFLFSGQDPYEYS